MSTLTHHNLSLFQIIGFLMSFNWKPHQPNTHNFNPIQHIQFKNNRSNPIVIIIMFHIIEAKYYRYLYIVNRLYSSILCFFFFNSSYIINIREIFQNDIIYLNRTETHSIVTCTINEMLAEWKSKENNGMFAKLKNDEA